MYSASVTSIDVDSQLYLSVSYRESLMDSLLRENDDVAGQRREYLESRELLQRALEIVNEVRRCSLNSPCADVFMPVDLLIVP